MRVFDCGSTFPRSPVIPFLSQNNFFECHLTFLKSLGSHSFLHSVTLFLQWTSRLDKCEPQQLYLWTAQHHCFWHICFDFCEWFFLSLPPEKWFNFHGYFGYGFQSLQSPSNVVLNEADKSRESSHLLLHFRRSEGRKTFDPFLNDHRPVPQNQRSKYLNPLVHHLVFVVFTCTRASKTLWKVSSPMIGWSSKVMLVITNVPFE